MFLFSLLVFQKLHRAVGGARRPNINDIAANVLSGAFRQGLFSKNGLVGAWFSPLCSVTWNHCETLHFEFHNSFRRCFRLGRGCLYANVENMQLVYMVAVSNTLQIILHRPGLLGEAYAQWL